jgi:hypothetical protein
MLRVMLCKNFLKDRPETAPLSQHLKNILYADLTYSRPITNHDVSFCIGPLYRRVLRGISGTKRQKLTGGCRKLNNEEFHNNS